MAMTCTQILAETARRAALCLADESRAEIAAFIRGQQQSDGGFRGRASASDLYYTHFAVQTLDALGEPLPVEALAGYLHNRPPAGGAELVHLACQACVSARVRPGYRDDEALQGLGRFRIPGGGFREKVDTGSASAYACFLSVLAHEAQGIAVAAPEALIASLHAMSPHVTTAVAAKAMLLAALGAPEAAAADQLMNRAARKGGFRAASLAPIADLLSTATALCALRVLDQPLGGLRDSCTEFVESLWHDSGGFCGHWADSTPDCEYTYYALLALGAVAD